MSDIPIAAIKLNTRVLPSLRLSCKTESKGKGTVVTSNLKFGLPVADVRMDWYMNWGKNAVAPCDVRFKNELT